MAPRCEHFWFNPPNNSQLSILPHQISTNKLLLLFSPVQHITGTYPTGFPATNTPPSGTFPATKRGRAAVRRVQPPAPETPPMNWNRTTTWEATTLTTTALRPTRRSSWVRIRCRRRRRPPTRTFRSSICRSPPSPATAPWAPAATDARVPGDARAKTSRHTNYLQRTRYRRRSAPPRVGQQREMWTFIAVFLHQKTWEHPPAYRHPPTRPRVADLQKIWMTFVKAWHISQILSNRRRFSGHSRLETREDVCVTVMPIVLFRWPCEKNEIENVNETTNPK